MKRFVMIEHSRSPGDDRAARHIAERGGTLLWRRPFEGDRLESLSELRPDGVVVYGGGQGLDEIDRYSFLRHEADYVSACIEQDIPLLGVCLGGQIIAHALGAHVGPPEEFYHEFGYYEVAPTEAGRDFLPEPLTVTQAHFHAFDIPSGAERLATSAAFPNQAFRYGTTTYALQFHPECTIEGFRRWQEAPWAPYGKTGVQPRDEQDRLAKQHDPGQDAWFRGFLDALYRLKQPVAAA